MLKPVRWKAFHVIEFFLIFQRTFCLMIKCNLTENTATIAVTRDIERKTLSVMELIQTRDDGKKKKNCFYPASGISFRAYAVYQVRY